MPPLEHSFDGSDGVPFRAWGWDRGTAPVAVLGIVHGVTEHGRRAAVIGEAMAEAGIPSWSFDLRGHGVSGGRRGHLLSWRQFLDDLGRFLADLTKRYPGVPLFLFGHSLGSLIALAYAMESGDFPRPRGVIVSGLAVDPVGVARPHLVLIARLFSRIWPTFTVRLKTLGQSALSRDRQVDEAFLADPLVLRQVTARFGTEALALVDHVRDGAASMTLPLLGLHGDADPLNTVQGARGYFERVGSADKELKIYPGSLHEVYHDLDKDKVLSDVRLWIEMRGGKRGSVGEIQ